MCENIKNFANVTFWGDPKHMQHVQNYLKTAFVFDF